MPTCPICHASDARELPDRLASCEACDHVFEHPPVVTALYNKEYVAERYEKYATTEAMSYLRLGMVKSFVTRGRLLDVGYGNGAFVRAASAGGFDAYGNDVHGADYGIREAPMVSDELWDVVTFFDSLEHFPDLKPVRDLVRRAAFAVVSMPFRPKDFPTTRAWKHYRPGEHLHYFSLKSLSALFPDKRLMFVTDAEDAIRKPLGGEPNIFTAVFAQTFFSDARTGK